MATLAEMQDKEYRFINTLTSTYIRGKDTIVDGKKVFNDADVIFAIDASDNSKGTLFVNGVNYGSVVKALEVDSSSRLQLTVLDSSNGEYKTVELNVYSEMSEDADKALDKKIEDVSTLVSELNTSIGEVANDASSNMLQYKLVAKTDTTEGALKSYVLQQKKAADTDWADVEGGVTIDIPKDYLLKNASMYYPVEDDVQKAYIVLDWNTKDAAEDASASSTTMVDLTKLIDIYTVKDDSSTYLTIEGYEISIDVDNILEGVNQEIAGLKVTDASLATAIGATGDALALDFSDSEMLSDSSSLLAAVKTLAARLAAAETKLAWKVVE